MYILLVCVWILFYTTIPILNQNIKRNLISVIHSITCVILCLMNLPEQIFYLSSSYYTYDMILQILTTAKIFNASTISMSIHHIIGVYSLQYLISNNKELVDIFLYMFMLLEISNFPVYIMYHWKQSYGKKSSEKKFSVTLITKILLILEIVTYFVFRMTYTLYLLIINYQLVPMDLMIISVVLYLLSIFWWMNMIYQLKN